MSMRHVSDRWNSPFHLNGLMGFSFDGLQQGISRLLMSSLWRLRDCLPPLPRPSFLRNRKPRYLLALKVVDLTSNCRRSQAAAANLTSIFVWRVDGWPSPTLHFVVTISTLYNSSLPRPTLINQLSSLLLSSPFISELCFMVWIRWFIIFIFVCNCFQAPLIPARNIRILCSRSYVHKKLLSRGWYSDHAAIRKNGIYLFLADYK